MLPDLMRCRKECAALFFPLFLWLFSAKCGAQVPVVPPVSGPVSSSGSSAFVRNDGQWHPDVRYAARLDGVDAWITDRGIVYDFYRYLPQTADSFLPLSLCPGSSGPPLSHRSDRNETAITDARAGHVIRMEFLGADGTAIPVEGSMRGGYNNYMVGSDRSKWAVGVPRFGAVSLRELYPGVDAVIRLDGGSIRYDLHVAPGADPQRIRMRLGGAGEITVNGMGELVLGTSVGQVVHGSIFAYQTVDGRQREVPCRFVKGVRNEVAFSVGEYDRRYPLVIDPLVYSTFVSGTDYGTGGSLVADAEGYVYVTGRASTSAYPTTEGAYDRTHGGGSGSDIVVTKLSPDGRSAIYSTYVGGSYNEMVSAIAIDSSRNVYVLGSTESGSGANNFPVTPGAYDTVPPERGSFGNDIVIFKLDETGSQLLYSTFVGERGNDWPGGIAVDKSGNAYITGATSSEKFPVSSNAYKKTPTTDGFFWYEVFVTKLNADGSELLYSTFLGGEEDEWGYDIAVDDQGYAYVTGETNSFEFPTTPGAYDRTFDPGTNEFIDDAFVTKLNQDGSALVYSTFLGKSQNDRGRGIAVDPQGNAYVTGYTSSPDFPTTPGAFDDRLSGLSDGFVTKLDPTGSTLLYSTFIGGDEDESFYKIALTEEGNAVVAGTTTSENFKTTAGAYSSRYSDDGETDVALAALTPSGSALIYATYFGSRGSDYVTDVAVGPTGEAIVGGYTVSPTFPRTPDAYDTLSPTSQSNRQKIFVAGFRLACALNVHVGADISICSGTSLQLNTEVRDGVAPFTYAWSPAQGLDRINIANPVASPVGTTQYVVTVTDGSGCVARDTINISVLTPPVALAGADTAICEGGAAVLGEETQEPATYTYTWEPAIGLSDPTVARPVARPAFTQIYVLTVSDTKNCRTRDTVVVTVLDLPSVDLEPEYEICPGEEVTIGSPATGGSGVFRYEWRPATGLSSTDVAQPVASPATTTVYRVTVTDDLGCSVESDPITVAVREKPMVTITALGPTTFCEGDSVTLDAGQDHQSYLWSNGATTRTVRVGAAGAYTVEITDVDGCTALSDPVTVQVEPAPKVTISGSAEACEEGTGVYTVPAEANVVYEWQLLSGTGAIVDGANTNRIVVQWGGVENAIVRLTARRGGTDCIATADYPVTVGSDLKPVIQGPPQPLLLCPGESVELDAGEGYVEYRWSTGETTRTIRIDSTASVTVTVTDAGGCVGTSDDYEVTVKSPAAVRLSTAGDARLCPGATLMLTAPAGYASYQWSGGETGATIEVVDEGEYWVDVRDADGCTIRSDTARVLRTEDPPAIVPAGDVMLCEGESITLSAAEGYAAYLWSNGQTGRSVEVTTAGAYSVTVTGHGGCTNTSAAVTVTILPAPAVPTVTRVGDTLISSPGPDYQWVRNGIDIPAATERRFVIDRAGAYRVRVTNAEGCSVESDEIAVTRNRVVWLDTVGGEVGERLWLTMHIDPPLLPVDGVTDFNAWIRLDPAALYPHGATSGSGVTAGDDRTLTYDMRSGAILVAPVRTGSPVVGEVLFRLELEGLVTGRPVNAVEIDSLLLGPLGSIPIAADGVVTLTGCEVDRRFSKRARIVSVNPNPGTEEVMVIYRTPEGMRMNLRLVDALGRVLKTRTLEAGSGAEEVVRVELNGLPAGLYLLELRDREEVVTAPLLIKR